MDNAARIAKKIVDDFWMSSVQRIALGALTADPSRRAAVQIYPPHTEQYEHAATTLRVLSEPATSELSLAVPEPSQPKKAGKARASRQGQE